ncbi:unnamed protein product [Phytomonas sp. EM1]|nr:unnamed protein product [Phytomonas sp. EM1]|eukprot:CCW64117.1 unnamed protein product [Phytomonas sp. isolate EM1]
MRKYGVKPKSDTWGRPWGASYNLNLTRPILLHNITSRVLLNRVQENSRRVNRRDEGEWSGRDDIGLSCRGRYEQPLPVRGQPPQSPHRSSYRSRVDSTRIGASDLPEEFAEVLIGVLQRLHEDEAVNTGAKLFSFSERSATKADLGWPSPVTAAEAASDTFSSISAGPIGGEGRHLPCKFVSTSPDDGSEALMRAKNASVERQTLMGVDSLSLASDLGDLAYLIELGWTGAISTEDAQDLPSGDMSQLPMVKSAPSYPFPTQSVSSGALSKDIHHTSNPSRDVRYLLTLGTQPNSGHHDQPCSALVQATAPALQAATELLLRGLDVKALLRGGTLDGIRIAHKCLSQADFSFIQWRQVHVEGCDLSRGLFYGAIFGEEVSFTRCNFEGSILKGVMIHGNVQFTDCSFRLASLGLIYKSHLNEDTDCTNKGSSLSSYRRSGKTRRTDLRFDRCDFDLASFEGSIGLNDSRIFANCFNEQNSYKYPLHTSTSG